MPALLYGIYILISRPHYDDTLRAWVPYASVSSYADSSKSYYYQLNKLKETFETEEEALAFGFSAARHWIDEHKAD
jgi:hypothetical protein